MTVANLRVPSIVVSGATATPGRSGVSAATGSVGRARRHEQEVGRHTVGDVHLGAVELSVVVEVDRVRAIVGEGHGADAAPDGEAGQPLGRRRVVAEIGEQTDRPDGTRREGARVHELPISSSASARSTIPIPAPPADLGREHPGDPELGEPVPDVVAAAASSSTPRT